MDIPQNPNPNYSSGTDINLPDFELSDYLIFEDGLEEEFSLPDVVVSSVNVTRGSFQSGGSNPINSNMQVYKHTNFECKNGAKQNKVAMDAGSRITIRMQSEMEFLDDGFKWRKYGKKKVKNNPNPSLLSTFLCRHSSSPSFFSDSNIVVSLAHSIPPTVLQFLS
ncbi:hypothetical protein LguiA_003854 [Lonicera macranthoides]